MPIDMRAARSHGIVTALLLVIALGSGWYSVPADFDGDLELIDVGWWNIRDFSTTSRDEFEIEQIADCIRGIEVLAVGELNNPLALVQLAQEMGDSWMSIATPNKIGRTPRTAEYYGFMWDSDVVELVGTIHVDEDPDDGFDREPAWATFRTLDGGFDFTLICVHVTWGKLVGPRKAEIRSLPDVWARILDASGDEDLILVGDFNRIVGDSSFEPLIALPGVLRANEDTGPTKIRSSSTYDQIFLSVQSTREWTGEWETYNFDEELFDNDDVAANLAVSDHRPVWISLYASEDDDD